jgi:hypothetical protein
VLLLNYFCCCLQVNEPDEEIVNMNENYWLIRAEPVAADEVAPLPPGHRLIHVYHISSPKPDAAAAANNNGAAAADGTAAAPPATPANSGGGGFVSGSGAAGSVATFGDPFLLRIAPDETLGQVRACSAVCYIVLIITYGGNEAASTTEFSFCVLVVCRLESTLEQSGGNM